MNNKHTPNELDSDIDHLFNHISNSIDKVFNEVFGVEAEKRILLDCQFDLMADEIQKHEREHGTDQAYAIMVAQLTALRQVNRETEDNLEAVHRGRDGQVAVDRMECQIKEHMVLSNPRYLKTNESMDWPQRTFTSLLNMNLKTIRRDLTSATEYTPFVW